MFSRNEDPNNVILRFYISIFQLLHMCMGQYKKSYIEMLNKLQKHAVRLIAGVKKFESSSCHFSSLNILHINELYVLSVQLFMYKYINSLLPEIFQNFFVYNSDMHDYPTRNSGCFRTPVYTSERNSSFIRFTGVHIFNELHNSTPMSYSYQCYKQNIKKVIRSLNVITLLQLIHVMY